MDETRDVPPAPDPDDPRDDGFEPRRMRTLADMTRPRDRLVAGVCTGVGRHLGIDPVVVRVLALVLTFVGFAGPILYVAAWVLIRSDDAAHSPVARLFRLDANEPQVRAGGLLVAVVVAVLAVVGDGGWGWGLWPALWVLLWLAVPVAFVYWLLVARRRPRPGPPAAPPGTGPGTSSTLALPGEQPTDQPSDRPSATRTATLPPAAPPRTPFSWALTVLTLSVGAIALAATFLATADDPLPATTYVAIALGVTAVGVLVGTVAGDAMLLVPIGIVLAAALVVGSVLPSLRLGEQRLSPQTAAQVEDTYRHGMGIVRLDLSQVADPQALLGRTVRVSNGLGQVRVTVPRGLAVDVEASARAGDVVVLDRREGGTALRVDVDSPDPGPVLTLDLDVTAGQVEVVRP